MPRWQYYLAVETLIQIKNVTYAWLKPDAPENPEERIPDDLDIIFEDFSVALPAGMISVLGPNGVGKSTFLLLAGARIFPLEGSVSVAGRVSTDFLEAFQNQDLEDQRNQLVSFVYQNMEFETEEPFGTILSYMADQADPGRRQWLDKAVDSLELSELSKKRPQDMAKGELQRAVIALALYYGSPIIIMDEPVFALEDDRKHRVFAFLRDYAAATGTTIIYSAHDFDLCRDYAQYALLLWKEDGKLHHELGHPQAVCSPERLELAYRAPMDTLHKKERLYRDMLMNHGSKDTQ